MDNLIALLYKSSKTVFNIKDLALLWEETNANNLKSKIAYYVKQRDLIRLSRGIYAKDADYDPKELATSFYAPSYISFETVLREAGIIFQHYDTIFVAGPWSLTKKIGIYSFTFRKLKQNILFNSTGIKNETNISQAEPERAFLDLLYLFPEYYFDHLKPINWDRCFELVNIYNNQQLIKRLKKYQNRYA